MDNLAVSLANIGAQSRIFADQCVLKGFVPPHPGDLGRVLGEDVIEKALRKGKDASEQDLGVGEAVACTDDERGYLVKKSFFIGILAQSGFYNDLDRLGQFSIRRFTPNTLYPSLCRASCDDEIPALYLHAFGQCSCAKARKPYPIAKEWLRG